MFCMTKLKNQEKYKCIICYNVTGKKKNTKYSSYFEFDEFNLSERNVT